MPAVKNKKKGLRYPLGKGKGDSPERKEIKRTKRELKRKIENSIPTRACGSDWKLNPE